MSETVCVMGAGSFGTALAKVLAEGGHEVRLWARDPVVVDTIRAEHRHPRRLKNIRLPPGLRATTSLQEGLTGAGLVVSSVPTLAVRGVWADASPFVHDGAYVMSASKGIENGTLALVSDILQASVPAHCAQRLCYLSGPSFAIEMAKRLPTAVTIAAVDEAVAAHVQRIISTDYFRAYTTTDVQGVELGGALKNVISIAGGIVDGLGFGDNTKAALLTRGVVEMARLGVALGAQRETMFGLAGIGDLITSCISPHGRNRAVGIRVGRGEKVADIVASMMQVAEGVRTAAAVHDLAARHKVEMPICEQVFAVLHQDKDPSRAVRDLMGRQLKDEQEW